MSSNAISVRGISKAYRLFHKPSSRLTEAVLSGIGLGRAAEHMYHLHWAVRDVSFDIPRGTTFGIVGSNGSGKSTLLQLVCGVLPATSGSVWVRGRVTALLELAAGFNPEFSGRENARFNAALLGLSPSQIASKIEEIEAFADIGPYFDQPVKTYSSGMYVRVGFAVQACFDPEVLVVDEALAVGDARFQAKCMARIRMLKEAGTSIMFVSHDVGSVRSLCDKVLWLDKGLPRMLGDVNSVTAAYMAHLFEGETTSSAATVAADEIQPSPSTVVDKVDKPPINHWGSRCGVIQSFRIENEHGKDMRSFSNGREIEVVMAVDLPHDIDLLSLGLAFSLKNLKGEDLIVGTSWLGGREDFQTHGRTFEIRFSFPLMLRSGPYMLSLAVEKRVPNAATEYYEYMDGCAVFEVLSHIDHLATFTPPIKRRIVNRPSASGNQAA